MHWVLLGIIAVALLFASARYPKFAFGTLAALLGLGIALYFLSLDEVRQGQQRITVDQVLLSHVEMTRGYAGSYNFSGRLTNQSADHALREVEIRVVMSDCPPQAADAADECVIIGETVKRIAREVPPGQARDFRESVFFSAAHPKGDVRWQHAVIATHAR